MKKIIPFLLLLALCLSLTACGGAAQPAEPAPEEAVCAHQWTEADCETPSTCALCGEVQPEAPGHSYSSWLLDAETMYRTCALCAQVESAEIDYPLFLSQNITGRWNFCKSDNYGTTPPSAFRDEEIWFCEDGRVIRRSFDEEVLSESWSFDHAEYDSEHNEHLIYITAPDGSVFKNAHFSAMKEDIFFILEQEDGDRHTLEKNRSEAMASVLCGTWSTWADGSLYSITLSEDRTFTGDFDGEVTGQWLPRSPLSDNLLPGFSMPANAYHTYTVMLHYHKDGAEKVLTATLGAYSADLSPDVLREQMSLQLNVHDRSARFSLDAKEALTGALSTAESELLGTWTTTDFTINTYNADFQVVSHENGVSTDYSITLNEDGTFHAQLHEMLEGTWKLGSVSIQSGHTQLSCDLTAAGIENASFSVNVGADARLNVNKSHTGNQYTLRRMTEEEIAAYNELLETSPSRIVGKWISVGAEAVEATFLEDGTFTVLSGTGDSQTELKGSWHFNTMSTHAENSIFCEYDIETTSNLSQMLGGEFDALFGGLSGFGFNLEESEVEISEERVITLSIHNDSEILSFHSQSLQCTLTKEAVSP